MASEEKQATGNGARNFKKSGDLLRERVGMRDQFVDTERKVYPIVLSCEVM